MFWRIAARGAINSQLDLFTETERNGEISSKIQKDLPWVATTKSSSFILRS